MLEKIEDETTARTKPHVNTLLTRATLVTRTSLMSRKHIVRVKDVFFFFLEIFSSKKTNKNHDDSFRNRFIIIIRMARTGCRSQKRKKTRAKIFSKKKKKNHSINDGRSARVLVSGGPRDDCRFAALPKRERGGGGGNETVGQVSVTLVGPRVHLTCIRGPTFRPVRGKSLLAHAQPTATAHDKRHARVK